MPSSLTPAGEMFCGVRCSPSVTDEQPADGDHDHVVDHRRPHVRAEPPAGVQDGAEQRVHPVEEDLRDKEVREDHHHVVLGGARAARRPVDVARVQVDQAGTPGMVATTVTVSSEITPSVKIRSAYASPRSGSSLAALTRSGTTTLGEDAAEHQVVHGVRQRVGVVVGVRELRGCRARRPARTSAGTRCPGTRACPAPSPGWNEPGSAGCQRSDAARCQPSARRGCGCGCPRCPAVAACRARRASARRAAAAPAGIRTAGCTFAGTRRAPAAGTRSAADRRRRAGCYQAAADSLPAA